MNTMSHVLTLIFGSIINSSLEDKTTSSIFTVTHVPAHPVMVNNMPILGVLFAESKYSFLPIMDIEPGQCVIWTSSPFPGMVKCIVYDNNGIILAVYNIKQIAPDLGLPPIGAVIPMYELYHPGFGTLLQQTFLRSVCTEFDVTYDVTGKIVSTETRHIDPDEYSW